MRNYAEYMADEIRTWLGDDYPVDSVRAIRFGVVIMLNYDAAGSWPARVASRIVALMNYHQHPYEEVRPGYHGVVVFLSPRPEFVDPAPPPVWVEA